MAHTLLLEYLQRDGMVLTWDESEAAVAEIFEPVTKPPLIYVHNWTPGDLVVW
jgi:alpha-ketoglutarate-dependent taurine dioxygenase